MLDHVGLRVRDLDRSVAFYQAVLFPLGYSVRVTSPAGVGLGETPKPDFWLYPGRAPDDDIHVAFGVTKKAMVYDFMNAAVTAGALIRSLPALRPEYHAGYYSTFVSDPDGYNLEVVHHDFAMAVAARGHNAPPASA